MVRPGARRAAVFLVSAVLASVFAAPLVGLAGAAETPSSACPSQGGTQQHMAESLTVRVAVNGVGVGGLWGNVAPGSTVDVSVVVPPGCPAVELTLASYNSPIAGFSVDQWLAHHQTRTIPGTGARESFSVQVPDCYFQVDFAYGAVITDFRQGMYGPRLIGSDVGGTRTCEQIPAPEPAPGPTPPETVTPGPTPPETGTPGPCSCPTPPETVTPGPTPPETVTPGPTPPETVTPGPTPPETGTPGPTPSVPETGTPGSSSTPFSPALPGTPPRAAPAPSSTPSSGVLGVSATPAPAPSMGVLGVSATPAPAVAAAPAGTARVAGDTRVARLASTGIPGSLLALVALLFGTAGVLLLVSARLRGGRARDRS